MNDAKNQRLPVADHAQILEQVGVAVISIDAKGLICSVNKACVQVFGYAVEDLLGKNVKMLMPSENAEHHDGYLHHHITTGEERIIGKGRQVNGCRADGTIFPMHLSVGRHENNENVYFTGIVHDLSEQEQIREHLVSAVEQSRKMDAIAQLTGGIGHDFNNLLTVISGNLELLQLTVNDKDECELLDEALKASAHAAKLIEQLLSFSSQSLLSVQRLNLNDAILDLSDLLRRSAGSHISLHTVLSPDIWPIITDLSKIDVTLLSLTNNACEAMPDGGRLTIETRNHKVSDKEARLLEVEAGKYVELIVTDTGQGMEQEQMRRVFDPFFTTKPKAGSHGLGLSVAYGFARQSGGSLRVESKPGMGSRFSVLFPKDDTGSVGAGPISLEKHDSHRQQGCILLVDDEASVRRLTTRRFLRMGHTVIEAENAADALVLFCDHPEVDVLFTDMVMPGDMSGWDLAQQVLSRSPDIPVIISSGYSDELSNEPKLQRKGVFILHKPYSMDSLSTMLTQALHHRKLQ